MYAIRDAARDDAERSVDLCGFLELVYLVARTVMDVLVVAGVRRMVGGAFRSRHHVNQPKGGVQVAGQAGRPTRSTETLKQL